MRVKVPPVRGRRDAKSTHIETNHQNEARNRAESVNVLTTSLILPCKSSWLASNKITLKSVQVAIRKVR